MQVHNRGRPETRRARRVRVRPDRGAPDLGRRDAAGGGPRRPRRPRRLRLHRHRRLPLLPRGHAAQHGHQVQGGARQHAVAGNDPEENPQQALPGMV